ncbi:unnamed protein product [Orchesella dallaii]|uniref:Uncharacterized protein n=1 Tax=Orchesella dallaii TaxID=48710 RepID=A0ABP1Q3I2_9HEXA
MAKSNSHLRLVALIALFLVSKSFAFDTPPYKSDHDSALQDSDEWLEWHGLDYHYNMDSWNLSSSEESDSDSQEGYSYDDSEHSHEPITIGTPTNTNASSSVDIEEKSQDKNETVAVAPTEQLNDTSENEVSSEVSDKVGSELQWASSATSTSKNETRKLLKGKASEEDYDPIVYWDQDGGSDDDDDDADFITNKNPEKLQELPTDNDEGANKLFNPEMYQELETLHQIQDNMLGEWTVLYADTNLPCIMFKGKISLIVPVSPAWSNREYVELDVPYDAKAFGSCNSLNNDYQQMVLKWNVTERNKTYLNTVNLGFGTNWTSEFSDLKVPEDQYALVAVTAAYYNGEVAEEGEDNGGDQDQGLVSYSVSDLTEFMTPINHSMSCFREKSILLGRMQLTFTDIQFEAFRPNLETLPFGDFMNSVLCETDEILVFDAVMTFIIWFWIGALFVVLVIFVVLLSLSYRRKAAHDGFGYKVLSA